MHLKRSCAGSIRESTPDNLVFEASETRMKSLVKWQLRFNAQRLVSTQRPHRRFDKSSDVSPDVDDRSNGTVEMYLDACDSLQRFKIALASRLQAECLRQLMHLALPRKRARSLEKRGLNPCPNVHPWLPRSLH